MIAVDTSVLLAAHRAECTQHARSAKILAGLCEGREPWGLPLDVITEFLRLATHERLFNPPSPSATALAFVHALVSAPACKVLLPGKHRAPMEQTEPRHQWVEDRIAACCRRYNVQELLTA